MKSVTKVSIILFKEIAKACQNTTWLNSFTQNLKYNLILPDKLDPEIDYNMWKHLSFICHAYEGTCKLEGHVLNEFIYNYLITCSHCEYVYRVGQYYFGE